MTTFTTALIAISALMITGCTTTGESYTDEGTRAHAVETSTTASSTPVNSDLLENSANLPEIAAYDEPEIPVLEAPAAE